MSSVDELSVVAVVLAFSPLVYGVMDRNRGRRKGRKRGGVGEEERMGGVHLVDTRDEEGTSNSRHTSHEHIRNIVREF